MISTRPVCYNVTEACTSVSRRQEAAAALITSLGHSFTHLHAHSHGATPACRDELLKLGLGTLLHRLEAAAGQDKNLLRYIQRAQQKLSTAGPAPPGHH
jgi:hypothetical protein